MAFLFRKDKHQYLEVNFNSKVKIIRLTTKGLEESFVTSISLFYSDDRVIFKPLKQGSKTKGVSIKPGTWNIPEHAGTFRNIPEHEKIKIIFMKKKTKKLIIT